MLEISPEVVDGSRFFEAENHRALADPRTKLVVGDGRTHLMLGRQAYDVIVSEPSNPWMAGIASLFTREFFEGARDRLAPGGVLCQWAHTYDISNRDLKSIVATFLSVFPNGTLWLVGDADVLLVGSTEPLDARIGGMAAAMQRPGVAADLATVGVKSPFAVTTLFISQGDALKAWAAGEPLQTDDRSALEFSGPRSIFGATRDDNAAALRALAASSPKPAAVASALAAATTEDWRDRGLMLLKADAMQPAYDDLARALETNPNDTAALDGLLRAAVSLNKVIEVERLLTRLAANPANTGGQTGAVALAGLAGQHGGGDPHPARVAAGESRRRAGPRATGIHPVRRWGRRPARAGRAASCKGSTEEHLVALLRELAVLPAGAPGHGAPGGAQCRQLRPGQRQGA